MTWLELINMPEDKILNYSLNIFATIFPGMGYIFLFNPIMFSNLSLGKLILVSIFYSLPLLLLGYFMGLIMVIFNILDTKRKPHNLFKNVFFGCSIFVLIAYFITLLYIISFNVQKHLLYYIYGSPLCLMMIYIIVETIMHYYKNKKNGKN